MKERRSAEEGLTGDARMGLIVGGADNLGSYGHRRSPSDRPAFAFALSCPVWRADHKESQALF